MQQVRDRLRTIARAPFKSSCTRASNVFPVSTIWAKFSQYAGLHALAEFCGRKKMCTTEMVVTRGASRGEGDGAGVAAPGDGMLRPR